MPDHHPILLLTLDLGHHDGGLARIGESNGASVGAHQRTGIV